MHEELLKKNNLSVTQQRIAILKALEEVSAPVTIEQLRKRCNFQLDTSTLYRSLKSLVDKGIIYQTDFREGVSYFEFQKNHHHHIICVSCKKQETVDTCVTHLFPSIEKKTGFIISNHMFEIFGICENCS